LLSDFLTLFLLALLSATLLPGGSEAYLLLLQQQYDALFWLWLIATLGNTLGSAINYWLGHSLLHFKERRWFPVSPTQLIKSERWFKKYGVWSLLLAWLPLIGDGLTLIAGVLKVNFALFFTLVLIGKGARYGALLGVGSWLFNH